MEYAFPQLRPRITSQSRVTYNWGETWHLEIPPGPRGVYRLAQLDDYAPLARAHLPWKPPVTLQLKARVSEQALPGTWGFGLWNDPFSLSLGLGGMGRRFPALPNAAWYFYASPPNYLSFRDDLPAQGLLAATFAASWLPTWLVALGSLGLPLALAPFAGKLVRGLARRFVRQGAQQVRLDPSGWHEYRLDWQDAKVTFEVDGEAIHTTLAAPIGPLGLVLWIDNQYAAWPPDGRLRYGFLENNRPAWLEITGFKCLQDQEGIGPE